MSENNLFHFAQVVSEMPAQPHSNSDLSHTENPRPAARIRQVRSLAVCYHVFELNMTIPTCQNRLGMAAIQPVFYPPSSNIVCFRSSPFFVERLHHMQFMLHLRTGG